MEPREFHSRSLGWITWTLNFARSVACLWMLTLLLSQRAHSSASDGSQRLAQIEERLRAINKPAVKTIASPDGDTIDCILRHKQPAFDHPLLKDHKLQEFPASKNPFRGRASVHRTAQTWHHSGQRCPEGTIPVRRTTAEDLIRFESPELYGKRLESPQPLDVQDPDPDYNSSINLNKGHEYAVAYSAGGAYHGAKAVLNVWQPFVENPGEFSASEMVVSAGSIMGFDLNCIQAGWQVYPAMYGDGTPRLFIYWTADAYESTGCYNLLCPGFVQTNGNTTIGASVSPVSLFNNTQFQYEFELYAWKDPDVGNWWLHYEDDVSPIGYWPAELFNTMTDHADSVLWGGEILNKGKSGHHTATQMGSGQFAQSGYGRASYIRGLQIVNPDDTVRNVEGVATLVQTPTCYNLTGTTPTDKAKQIWFYFGGPGRNTVDCL